MVQNPQESLKNQAFFFLRFSENCLQFAHFGIKITSQVVKSVNLWRKVGKIPEPLTTWPG